MAAKFTFPAAAEDVEAAIDYVQKNPSRYRVDPRRIVLIGESAGGQLVSYIGARNQTKSRIAAVVSLYGIHDFVSACAAWKPVPKEVFELFGIRSIDADTVSLLITASPVIYVNRDMPPFLLIHGTKDEDVPYEQSVEMCEKARTAGGHCDLIPVDGAPHGMDRWEAHAEFLWYKKALTDWLRKTVK